MPLAGGHFLRAQESGRLRMIEDGRQGNQRMRPPPKTSMPSAAAFSELWLGQGEKLRVSTYENQDCFVQFCLWCVLGRCTFVSRLT